MVIGDELRDFIESDVTVDVATADARLVPEIARGWGPRVVDDGRALDVFVDRSSSATTITNLTGTGRVAVRFGTFSTYRVAQLKGTFVEVGEPTPSDQAWVASHRLKWAAVSTRTGMRWEACSALWSDDLQRLRFSIDTVLDRNPAPPSSSRSA